jgi:secreted PhoX family phosphatase
VQRRGALDRREFLTLGVGTAAALSLAVRLPRLPTAGGVALGDGGYGPLQPSDANGLMLPEGFASRELARSTQPVGPNGYLWHTFPDGGATFPAGRGWIYTSNSEYPQPGAGGAGALRFDRDGEVVDAYSILTGTQTNCAGGPTPWGTWLSCEEHDTGLTWECDPTGEEPARSLPALGTFRHEAAAVDPKREQLYLTEDERSGRFYRFTPRRYPSLEAGTLEVAVVDGERVRWLEVPDPAAATTPTREQVPESTPFNGGEGIWYRRGIVYFATKGDRSVWAYDVRRARVTKLVDPAADPNSPVSSVDNLAVTPAGDVLIAEDQNEASELIVVTRAGAATPLLRFGPEHTGSELCGPAFSPDGTRLYFSSERGAGGPGATYEVTGPFAWV